MNRLLRFQRNINVVRRLAQTGLAMQKFAPEKAVSYSDALAPHIDRNGDRPALIGDSRSMSWRQFDEYANRVAHWARGQGLGHGDIVALSMENRPEYIAIWFGLSRLGIVTALMNTNLTGDRLAHCIREAAPRHWIVGTELVAECASALPFLEDRPEVFHSGAGAGAEADARAEVELPAEIAQATSFDDAISSHPTTPTDPAWRADLHAGDPLFLIYTSGTTGLPKAARISHTKALVTGMASRITQGLNRNDRIYCCLPLYHSAGGMMAAGAALTAGGALVISRKFSAKRFWSDCAQHDVTSIQYIGELCRYLLNSPQHPDERRHQIRYAIGNGLRPEVWEPFQKRFQIPRIYEFYGATEGNMALVNFDGRVGAVGQLPHLLRKAMGIEILRFDVEAEELVRDPKGFCELADYDEPGEAVIKISKTSRFEGYTNAEATEKKILRDAFDKGDAYFRTGDLLRLDQEGFFYFVDRIGDTFRWKGENVATSEIAEVIGVHPGILEANVYGVAVEGADGRAGMAALVANENLDLEALGRRIDAELASYARPLFIRILPEMEITGTFKHRKVDLVRDGFDPSKISDPLYFRDPDKGSYQPLDLETYERIQSGAIRI
jgi:fatty-acyl-CoA synthase